MSCLVNFVLLFFLLWIHCIVNFGVLVLQISQQECTISMNKDYYYYYFIIIIIYI